MLIRENQLTLSEAKEHLVFLEELFAEHVQTANQMWIEHYADKIAKLRSQLTYQPELFKQQ